MSPSLKSKKDKPKDYSSSEEEDEVSSAEEFSESETSSSEDEEEHKQPKKRKKKKKIKLSNKKEPEEEGLISEEETERRKGLSQPPVVHNGGIYFYIMFGCCMSTWMLLWWAWYILASTSVITPLLICNTIIIGFVLFYWKVCVFEDVKMFIEMWFSRRETMRRKLKSVIDMNQKLNKQLYFICAQLSITFCTAIFGLPSIVLRGNWWQEVSNLPGDMMALFVLLVISLVMSVLSGLWLCFHIVEASTSANKAIENNDFAVLPETAAPPPLEVVVEKLKPPVVVPPQPPPTQQAAITLPPPAYTTSTEQQQHKLLLQGLSSPRTTTNITFHQ